MTRPFAAATVLAALLATSPAFAQQPSSVVTTPPDMARWDVTGHIGWFGAHKDNREEWDDWYGAFSGGGSAGYYWTPHVKVEFDVTATTEGDVHGFDLIAVPGQAAPFYRGRRDIYRNTIAGAGLSYQFMENAWFHPFLGAGVEAVRESQRSVLDGRGAPVFTPPGVPFAPPPGPTETRVLGRPFVTGGFKGYVSERAFIRTDLRLAVTSSGVVATVWRLGLGFDF